MFTLRVGGAVCRQLEMNLGFKFKYYIRTFMPRLAHKIPGEGVHVIVLGDGWNGEVKNFVAVSKFCWDGGDKGERI